MVYRLSTMVYRLSTNSPILRHLKNNQALFLLFTANAISGFAQGMSMLAVPWYFAVKQQSEVFNFSYGVLTFGVLFFGLYAGTLVDKYSRKKNFLFTNLFCGIVVFGVALIGILNQELPNLMVILVFGLTMFNYNIHYPTLYAFAHEITEPQEYQRVNSWIEIVGQSTSILSGALAAVLLDGLTTPFVIAKWEIWDIFLLDGTTYFLAALLIYFIKHKATKYYSVQTGTVFERVKTGFSYLKKHPQLLVFGLFSYAVFAALIVAIHSLLPLYVDRHLHREGSVFALADMIYAIGALGAGLFVGKVFEEKQTVRAIIILTFLASLIFLWLFVAKSVWVLYVYSILLGFSNAGIRVLRLTYFFQHIPNEVMGRVNSIFNMSNVFTRSAFIFLFSIPFFNFGSNVIYTFLILSAFLGVAGLILILNNKKENAF